MAITDNEINKEMARIHTLRQEAWNYVKPRLAFYQGINVPAPYVPASDEDRRNEAIENLRKKQAMIDHETKQEKTMWDARNAAAASRYAAVHADKSKRGGYRKSRRSRTPKRVQKRKQTRRHRHRHRR